MKKGLLIILLFVVIILLALIGLNLTGRVIFGPQDFGIFRSVPFKNITSNTTDVRIRIGKNDNVIAIQENFSSSDCEVLNYSLDKDISIFEFNENQNIWILANQSDYLDVELFYSIPYDCDVISGKFYTVASFGNSWCNGADVNRDGVVDASDYIAFKAGADINKDGVSDNKDMSILNSEMGNNCTGSSDQSTIGLENNNYCYQESANSASSSDGDCGLNYGGSYPKITADSCLSKIEDGDWGTYCNAASGGAVLFSGFKVIYKKPEDAILGKWKIKSSEGEKELTIPEECWNTSDGNLYLFIRSSKSLTPIKGGSETYKNTTWGCSEDNFSSGLDRSQEIELYHSPNKNSDIYEEAMEWVIGNDGGNESNTINTTISTNLLSDSGTDSGTSSSGGGSYSTTNTNTDTQDSSSNEIIQTESEEEYEASSSGLVERIAGITDESQKIEKTSFYPFIILIIVAIIIVLLIIFFIIFKKPKEFEETPRKNIKNNKILSRG